MFFFPRFTCIASAEIIDAPIFSLIHQRRHRFWAHRVIGLFGCFCITMPVDVVLIVPAIAVRKQYF